MSKIGKPVREWEVVTQPAIAPSAPREVETPAPNVPQEVPATPREVPVGAPS